MKKKDEREMYTFVITEDDVKHSSLDVNDVGKCALVINGAIALIGPEDKVNEMFDLLKRSRTR